MGAELRRDVSIQSKLRVMPAYGVFFATGQRRLGSRAARRLPHRPNGSCAGASSRRHRGPRRRAGQRARRRHRPVEQRAEAVRARPIQEGVEPSASPSVPRLDARSQSRHAPMPTAARRIAAPLPWCLPPARASAWVWSTAGRRAPRRPCWCSRLRLSYRRTRLKSPAPGPCRVDKRCPRCWLGYRNDVVAAVAGGAEAEASHPATRRSYCIV